MNKVEFKPQREYVKRKGSGRYWSYIRGENPHMTINLNGVIVPDNSGDAQGVAVAAPGASITLANFGSGDTCHGYTGSDGKLILLEDATRTLGDEEEPMMDLNCTVCPFITPA